MVPKRRGEDLSLWPMMGLGMPPFDRLNGRKLVEVACEQMIGRYVRMSNSYLQVQCAVYDCSYDPIQG